MKIPLKKILPINSLNNYKVHTATSSDEAQPLDEFVKDKKSWKGWNEYRFTKNRFNRKYIFSLMDFYPDQGKIWLFGGVFRVLKRTGIQNGKSYEIELTELGKEYIGRLKIHAALNARSGSVVGLKLENSYPKMTVHEILKAPYQGEAFCGHQNICHTLNQLAHIKHQDRSDWKAALENVKGIYLITDLTNGKNYIGSAYSKGGIWSRWGSYIENGHGGNKELRNIVKEKGKNYALNNFQFSILEYMQAGVNEETVLEREKFWKKALLSYQYGYN